MAFDCLGLAVGLWASVASTWKPDQQYTFGYGRVETLSGFANGTFDHQGIADFRLFLDFDLGLYHIRGHTESVSFGSLDILRLKLTE
jgi:hypothetical protein